jgi:type IV pilus assembly protein PilP
MHYRRKPLGACLVLTLALAACTSSGQDELQAWMLSERNSIKPSVQPIPEPTRFVPQAYGGERLTPPFSTE